MPVPDASCQLSRQFSHQTRQTAYELFTPNNSGQRLRPTYYRGCWHVVSRRFFCGYRHPKASSPSKAVYNPKAVVPHAASLHQACAHCAIFPTAASRRSLGRVSVPVWPVTLSGRLPVTASVGHYPTDKLIGREPIPVRKTFHHPPCGRQCISGISRSFPRLSRRRGQVAHVLLTRSPLIPPAKPGFSVRLACVKHAASVRPEPESNSPSTNNIKRSRHQTTPHHPLTKSGTANRHQNKRHRPSKSRHTVEFSNNARTSSFPFGPGGRQLE